MNDKRRFLAGAGLVAAAVCWGAAHAAEPPAGALTLSFDQAWQAALAQTPQMLKARAQVAEAQGAVKAARGHLLPKLQASYTASGSDNGLNVFGMKLSQGKATFNDFGASQFNPLQPQSLFIAPSNLNEPGWYRNYQTKLELQIPVFNGGKVWAFYHKAEAYLQAARLGDEMARQQLLLEVLKAYEGVRAAKAFVGVAEKAEAAAKSFVQITDKLYARGVVSRNAKLRAELNLGDVELSLSKARARLATAKEQLRILTGLPEGKPIHVAQSLQVSLPRAPLETLQREAQADNPGLRALQMNLVGAQSGVWAARAAYLPHFNIVLSRQWDDTSAGLGGHPSNTVAGVLTWNLFDFGARGGALDQAQAQVLTQSAELRAARDKLRLQIAQAWNDVQVAEQRVRVRRLSIEQAQEALRLQKLRYEKGVATIAQLLTAQAELNKARSELVAARYQEIMQRAGLLLGLGQLTPQAIRVAHAGAPGL